MATSGNRLELLEWKERLSVSEIANPGERLAIAGRKGWKSGPKPRRHPICSLRPLSRSFVQNRKEIDMRMLMGAVGLTPAIVLCFSPSVEGQAGKVGPDLKEWQAVVDKAIRRSVDSLDSFHRPRLPWMFGRHAEVTMSDPNGAMSDVQAPMSDAPAAEELQRELTAILACLRQWTPAPEGSPQSIARLAGDLVDDAQAVEALERNQLGYARLAQRARRVVEHPAAPRSQRRGTFADQGSLRPGEQLHVGEAVRADRGILPSEQVGVRDGREDATCLGAVPRQVALDGVAVADGGREEDHDGSSSNPSHCDPASCNATCSATASRTVRGRPSPRVSRLRTVNPRPSR